MFRMKHLEHVRQYLKVGYDVPNEVANRLLMLLLDSIAEAQGSDHLKTLSLDATGIVLFFEDDMKS
jgi:hypothetical protein